MKVIASFDPALENLGICFMEFNDTWRDNIAELIGKLRAVYSGDFTGEEFQDAALTILKEIDVFLSNILKITYFNVFDLIPGLKTAKIPVAERTRRLKFLLHCLDEQLPQPDIVLIEHQMKHNDKSRAISHQILYHYIDISDDILVELKEKNSKRKSLKETEKVSNSITYAVSQFAMLPVLMDKKNGCQSDIIGTGLKNEYHVAPGGEHGNFVAKYTNYTANKKHTKFNFEYYVKHMLDEGDKILKIKNKTDDLADAFFLAFGWLKKNKWL